MEFPPPRAEISEVLSRQVNSVVVVVVVV